MTNQERSLLVVLCKSIEQAPEKTLDLVKIVEDEKSTIDYNLIVQKFGAISNRPNEEIVIVAQEIRKLLF